MGKSRACYPAAMRLGIPAVLCAALLACHADTWPATGDAASFREMDPAQARRLADAGGAQVVQVGPTRHQVAPTGALRVETNWVPPAGASGAWILLAEQPEAALRVAARLARAGIQGIVVVVGGLEAWNQDRGLATAQGNTRAE